MPLLTNIVYNSGDNISKERDINNQRGEMFRTFKDSVSPQISEQRNNIVNAAKNSSILGPVIQGYDKIKPFLPEVDLQDKTIEYEYF